MGVTTTTASAATYVPIATQTLGSNTATVTFSSINGSYTDLVIVGSAGYDTVAANLSMRVGNGSVDTGNNYSNTEIVGSGSSAGSERNANIGFMQINRGGGGGNGSTIDSNFVLHLMNYANTSTYKTALVRYNQTDGTYPVTSVIVNLWRSTAAVNTITLFQTSGNILAGSTFTLYGVKAA